MNNLIDDLLLLSGNDLPFPQAGVSIHQPRLKEIAYMTEQKFWVGCELFKFDKNFLSDQDKKSLLNKSNFNIIMMIMQEKRKETLQTRIGAFSLLALLFPTCEISLGAQTILLKDTQTQQIKEINNDNFEIFKEILINMFCLTNKENKQYNPSGSLAEKIANQLKRGRQKVAELAPNEKITIFSRYVSILAVAQKKSINELMDYTVYQLMDEFNRFQLKNQYDTWERFKIAGATGLEDPQDWLKDLHEESLS